jgi:hypothetical protein
VNRYSILLCLALWWSLGGCSAAVAPRMMPVDLMAAAPPLARIEGGARLAPLVVDWAAVDGAASVNEPDTVDWTTTSDMPAVLVLQTSVVPVRVIALDFAAVASTGIPRGLGHEYFCHVRDESAMAAVPGCAFVRRGDQIAVVVTPSQAGGYVVIQVAWLAPEMQQVSASWGFRISG